MPRHLRKVPILASPKTPLCPHTVRWKHRLGAHRPVVGRRLDVEFVGLVYLPWPLAHFDRTNQYVLNLDENPT